MEWWTWSEKKWRKFFVGDEYEGKKDDDNAWVKSMFFSFPNVPISRISVSRQDHITNCISIYRKSGGSKSRTNTHPYYKSETISSYRNETLIRTHSTCSRCSCFYKYFCAKGERSSSSGVGDRQFIIGYVSSRLLEQEAEQYFYTVAVGPVLLITRVKWNFFPRTFPLTMYEASLERRRRGSILCVSSSFCLLLLLFCFSSLLGNGTCAEADEISEADKPSKSNINSFSLLYSP